MRAAQDLRIGDVIRAMPDEKKSPVRVVVKVKPRDRLTYVETQHKGNANAKEVWELRSSSLLVVDSPQSQQQGAKK